MFLKTYVDPREREEIRARQGEDMWIVLHHIRAEKCGEFEHFLHAVLMPAVAHVAPEVYNKTRILHPTMPNKDGSYTFVFLMDPLVPDGEYGIENILHEFYKPEIAKGYIKFWEECHEVPQAEYDVVQSAW